jgi:hypothetical protein
MIARPFGRQMPDGDDHSGIARKLFDNACSLNFSIVRASEHHGPAVHFELTGVVTDADVPLAAMLADVLAAFRDLPPVDHEDEE